MIRIRWIGLILVMYFAMFSDVSGQVEDMNGRPLQPFIGLDTLVLRKEKIHRLEIVRQDGSKDTSAKGRAEKLLTVNFNAMGRIVAIKGCLPVDNDPCALKYDHQYYYEDDSLYAATSQYMDEGKLRYDSASYDLNAAGKITRVEIMHTVLNSSLDAAKVSIITFNYDEKGNLVQKEFSGFKPDGTGKVTFARDSLGRIITETEYDEDGKYPLQTVQHKYDAFGNELSRKEMDSRSQRCRHQNIPDKNGRIQKTSCYNELDSLTLTSTLTYDKKGRLIDLYSEEPRQPYGTITQFKYDNNGRLILKNQYMDNNSKVYKLVFKYDTAGKLIEELFFDTEGDLKSVYRYRYYK